MKRLIALLLLAGCGYTSIGAGAERLDKFTADPCSDFASQYPEGTLFYNDTSDYVCFCDAATTGKQAHSPSTDCFS